MMLQRQTSLKLSPIAIIDCSLTDPGTTGDGSCILAYKSQNLPQNLDLKVGGATYTHVIK